LRALLLQCLDSVRSERLLMEELDYNLLFRWFVGLNMDDPVWDPTVFSKNREGMMEADVARAFFEEVGQWARQEGLMSNQHFTVDGTLIEAWASQKSFKPKAEAKQPPRDSNPGNPSVNFRGEERRVSWRSCRRPTADRQRYAAAAAEFLVGLDRGAAGGAPPGECGAALRAETTVGPVVVVTRWTAHRASSPPRCQYGTHFTGTSAGAPLVLIKTTTNLAGLVLLAFRSTR